MQAITRWIATRFIKDHHKVTLPVVRQRYGRLEGFVSLGVNLVLFGVKLAAGLATQSIALIADAVHSLSDSLTSVVIIIGFKMAAKPSDRDHPFGHGRMEQIAALIVSVLLFVAGFELSRESFHHIMTPRVSAASWLAIAAIIASIIIKELLARFSFALGAMIDSTALKADAIHHRTDSISSLLVLVALIASRYHFQHLDGIMGCLVSLIIFYAAYRTGAEAIHPLIGQGPTEQEIARIEELAMSLNGVTGVHDIIIHKYGQTAIISLHIEVSDQENILKLHALSEQVEDIIANRFGGTVVAHLDPVNRQHPEYARIESAIRDKLPDFPLAVSFHDLRITGYCPIQCHIVFNLVLKEDRGPTEAQATCQRLETQLQGDFPNMKIFIKVEYQYGSS